MLAKLFTYHRRQTFSYIDYSLEIPVFQAKIKSYSHVTYNLSATHSITVFANLRPYLAEYLSFTSTTTT